MTAFTPKRLVPLADQSRDEPVPYSLPATTTSGVPAATCWPLSKCTFSTISLTLAVTATDSRALAVPMACKLSFHAEGCTTCVVTGTAAPKAADIAREVGNIRKLTGMPIAVGFGISTAAQAQEIGGIADGIVIGSAVVKLIDENRDSDDLKEIVCEYINKIKKSLG